MAIADPKSKVSFFLTASGGTFPTGWTENFYSQNANLDEVMTQAKQYAQARALLLGNGAQVEYIRISNIPANRRTKIYYMQGDAGQPKTAGQTPFNTDPTQVDLLLRVESPQGYRRQFWLAGLPDRETNQLIQQGIEGAFLTSASFKALVSTIIKNAYAIRFRATPPPMPTYSSETISSVQPIMVRNRKKGRPFDLARGRKLA